MPSLSKLSHSKVYKRPVVRNRHVASDRSGMSLRSHFQPGATIVQVRGAVEGANASRLLDYLDDVASATRPLILDLRHVDFFTGDGFRTLIRIAEQCQRSKVRWALVTSEAIDQLLRTTDSSYRLPIAPSVEEAMQQLTSADSAWSLPHRVTDKESTRC